MGSNDTAQLTQEYNEILFKSLLRISYNARFLNNSNVNPNISWEHRDNVLLYCNAPIFFIAPIRAKWIGTNYFPQKKIRNCAVPVNFVV